MKKILLGAMNIALVMLQLSLSSIQVEASATVVDDVSDFLMAANQGLTFHLQGKSGLIALSEFVNANTTNANNTAGNFFVLLPDDSESNSIELSGVSFIPIGTETSPFKGDFDGSGVTLNYLTIKVTNNTFGTGLFGGISNSKIEKLNLSGITTIQSNSSYVGSLVGNSEGLSLISGVQIFGDLYIKGVNQVGGLLGRLRPPGSGEVVAVSNTRIDTDIMMVSGSGTSSNEIGGFVGSINSSTTSNRSIIQLSSINSNQLTVSGAQEVGGFVGLNNIGVIRKSYITSDTLSVNGIGELGGFAGAVLQGGTIEDSYVRSTSFDITSSSSRVGGFIGLLQYSNSTNVLRRNYLSASTLNFIGGTQNARFLGDGGNSTSQLLNNFITIGNQNPPNIPFVALNSANLVISNTFYNSGLTGNAWIDASDDSASNLSVISGITLLGILNTGSSSYGLVDNNPIYEPTLNELSGQTASLIHWSNLFANTITYSGLLGGSDGGNPTSYVASDSNILLSSGVRDGYNFLGWFENADLETSGISEIDTSTGKDYTLYAKWSDPIDYTITYILNDNVDFPATSGVNSGIYTVESSTVTLSSGVRDFYTFDGWFENADLVTSGVTEIPTGSFGNKTLYAKWTPVSYLVTFDENNGVALSGLTYTVESGTVTLPTTTREGYTFSSWTLSGTPLTGNLLPIRSEDVTVQAAWQINQYTITFDTDGGSAVSPITQDYNSVVSEPTPPTKTGVRFTRWDPILPTTMPANNVTVTAIYSAPITTSGAITEPGTYYIEDVSGLIALREKVNAGSGLSGYTFVLLNDIELVDPWIPIGNISQRPFSGTFNGQGNIISNVSITGTETGIGFFGNLSSATILNVILEDVTISAYNRQNVGTIAGSSTNSTTISGVQVRGNISITANVKVGGFVGVNNGSQITNSSIDAATMSIIGSGTVEATQIGGFVGHNVNSIVNQSFIQVASITLRQEISTGTPNSRYGGFVGFNQTNASVTNSYLRADLISIAADSRIGSFIGSNEVSAVRSSMVASQAISLSGLSNVGQFIGLNNSNSVGVHNVIMISNQSDLEHDIIGLVNGSAPIENVYFNSGLSSSSWYSFDGSTSTLENTPLGDINGTALLSLINQSGLYALPSPTNSTFYIPILSSSATAFAERQENEVVYWLELPSPPPPPPVQNTPPPAPATPSPSTSSTTTTSEVRIVPLIETLHLIIDSGQVVFDVFSEIQLPDAHVELQFGYSRTVLEDALTITHEINNQLPGEYTVLYEARYNDLRVVKEVLITIVDREAPVIEGPATLSILRGDSWISGITVTDNVDLAPVVITPRVNVSLPGVYDVEIVARDASGNESVFIQILEIRAPRSIVAEAQIGSQSFLFVIQEPEFNLDRGRLETSIDQQTWTSYTDDDVYDMTQIIYVRYFDGVTSSEIKQTVPVPLEEEFIPLVTSTYVQLTTSMGLFLLIAFLIIEFTMAYLGYIVISPELEERNKQTPSQPRKK